MPSRMTIAEKMYELGMMTSSYPVTRGGSIAEARQAIIEGRVFLNGRLVTHTETPIPKQPGNYRIVLSNLNDSTEKYGEFSI